MTEDEAIRAIIEFAVEVLRWVMAHPTHLTVLICTYIVSRAMISMTAYARSMAVEMKTVEERREHAEIEADRDVQIERARAQSRIAAAKMRIATNVRADDDAAVEAQAEDEVVERGRRVRGGRSK